MIETRAMFSNNMLQRTLAPRRSLIILLSNNDLVVCQALLPVMRGGATPLSMGVRHAIHILMPRII